MDHTGIPGAHLQEHPHAEPISFGIEQILSMESCMLSARMHEQDYGHGAYNNSGANGGGYIYSNTGYNGTSSACGDGFPRLGLSHEHGHEFERA
ncbi:hypothetical protein CgunFtcFv8_016028 [Champsocephalus gunnari]|uniref:Uncharacterized protein n=1 Tax=Champsocephalus gunnari TaxID=52237 RepID=A0AAN8HA11_CHAGU|nr:hypothetical protein CgunFtcFv8_016028 [Champsocephalus gunnari]